MTERPSIRPDVRLDEGPMEPLACTTCSAGVEVRKSSWEQTSIQWNGEALEACHERRLLGHNPMVGFVGCTALSASIRQAALSGALPVQLGEPLPVNDAPIEGDHDGFHW